MHLLSLRATIHVSRITYHVSRITYHISQIADTKKPRYIARLWNFYAPLKQGALT
ncbi:hypothetical protein VCR26J2_700027 [Vibrio coralliirubri]|nr:hypothetical protein VCR26J2_700027 [Vibrio coralliirubri]